VEGRGTSRYHASGAVSEEEGSGGLYHCVAATFADAAEGDDAVGGEPGVAGAGAP
jgi:hypothetical protein